MKRHKNLAEDAEVVRRKAGAAYLWLKDGTTYAPGIAQIADMAARGVSIDQIWADYDRWQQCLEGTVGHWQWRMLSKSQQDELRKMADQVCRGISAREAA